MENIQPGVAQVNLSIYSGFGLFIFCVEHGGERSRAHAILVVCCLSFAFADDRILSPYDGFFLSSRPLLYIFIRHSEVAIRRSLLCLCRLREVEFYQPSTGEGRMVGPF